MQWRGVAEARPLVRQSTHDESCDIVRPSSNSSGFLAHSCKPAQVRCVRTGMLDDWLRDLVGNLEEFGEDKARLDE
jgi:hypothetical protein